MARCIALAGLITVLTARTAFADAVPVPDEIVDLAVEVGDDPVDLYGAVITTKMDPRKYLEAVGELVAPVPVYPWLVPRTAIEVRLNCAMWHESRGFAGAVNPYSNASGLLQFLKSTWDTTPQGRAGMSRLDPWANWEAAVWLANSYPGAFNHHWAYDAARGC